MKWADDEDSARRGLARDPSTVTRAAELAGVSGTAADNALRALEAVGRRP
jgi:hypothetical protein